MRWRTMEEVGSLFDEKLEQDIPDMLLNFRIIFAGIQPATETQKRIRLMYDDDFPGFMKEMRAQEKEYKDAREQTARLAAEASGEEQEDEGTEGALQAAKEWLERRKA